VEVVTPMGVRHHLHKITIKELRTTQEFQRPKGMRSRHEQRSRT
jgi:hypothetical protein